MATDSFARELSKDGLLVGFDLETTGVDPLTDRIVTAAVVLVDGKTRRVVERHEWMVRTPWEQVAASAEASAVHHIAPSLALRAGRPLKKVLHEVVRTLDACTLIARKPRPLVGANIQYDLAMLISEVNRLDSDDAPSLSFLKETPVLDARILYCKHQWNLTDCHGKLELIGPQLGIMPKDSHSAGDDAITACLVVAELLRLNPELAAMDLWALSDAQPGWFDQMMPWAKKKGEYWPFGLATESFLGTKPLLSGAADAASSTPKINIDLREGMEPAIQSTTPGSQEGQRSSHPDRSPSQRPATSTRSLGRYLQDRHPQTSVN